MKALIKLNYQNMSRTKGIIIFIFLFVPLAVSAQSAGVEFKKTLQRGMRGKDVKILQEFLKQSPEIYPQGLVTGYFGPLTEMAVKRLQESQGIEPVGIVGPKTKAKLNELVVETGFSVGGGGQVISATPATPVSPGGNGNLTSPATPATFAVPGGSVNSTTPATPATPAIPATTTPQSDQSTSTPRGNGPPTPTPSGTTPATPATPSSVSGPATPAVPAIPATSTLAPSISTSSADTTAPVTSNIQATNITQTSATITWTTDEVASSEIYYDLSPITVTSTIKTVGMDNVINHSVSLTNLSSGKTYYYIVVSKDIVGNTVTSSEYSFMTLASLTSYEERIIRITTNPADQEMPAISGNRIVWSDKRNGTWDIFMYDLATNIETQISNGPGDELDPHIFGNRIVYRDTRLNPVNPNYTITNIYLYDLNTNTSTIVGGGALPKIDGNNIVYGSLLSPLYIYRYNISDGQNNLVSTNGNRNPYISGSNIIYTKYTINGILYHYDLNSGIEKQIVSGNVPFRASVSNGVVAYAKRTGDGSQDFDMYVYYLNTNTEKKLTSQKGGALENISISGNRVVWTDTDDYHLYLYDLSTDQLTQLTSYPSQQYHSYIDGNRVVWADGRNGVNGAHDIYFLEL